MKFIKLGIISIIFFAIFLTLLSFFFPSHVRISKAVDIRTEKDSLLTQLHNRENWKNWYPGIDSLKDVEITGATDSTVQAGTTGWNIFPSGIPGTQTVQWYMDFHLRWYPWEKFSSLLLEKRFGPLMENGLTRLKNYLEGNK